METKDLKLTKQEAIEVANYLENYIRCFEYSRYSCDVSLDRYLVFREIYSKLVDLVNLF